jgi:hypothetical protein
MKGLFIVFGALSQQRRGFAREIDDRLRENAGQL